MPRVGFEPTITASERAKTVHASDRSATVPGGVRLASIKNSTGDSFFDGKVTGA
jgi:hypothetical protein